MNSVPLARPDALYYWREFEEKVKNEGGPRKRALLNFFNGLSFEAVSKANVAGPVEGVVTLDMRGVAVMIDCLFDRQRILLDVLTGEIREKENWSENS